MAIYEPHYRSDLPPEPALAPTAVRRGQSLSSPGKRAEKRDGEQLPQELDGAQDRRLLTTPVNRRQTAGDGIRTHNNQLGRLEL